MESKKLVVIGMGYVGIPAAALFADAEGFDVVGIQRKSKRSGWKIDYLNSGKSPFPKNEPGIEELIKRVVIEKRSFRVTDDFNEIKDADSILIDVQTPVEPENHEPRYESLREVCEKVGKLMKKGALVCLESTVAPGTTINIAKPIIEKASGMKAGEDFSLCFSYERVMVGRLLHNIQNYTRIVGGYTKKCAKIGVDVYKKIVKADVVATDCLTAEVAKTVENAYRDVNIAFANEVALISESLGINVYEVRELVNNLPDDPSNPAANPVRNMHIPGAGVGGHCLPKDSWLLKYGVDNYGKFPVVPKVIMESRYINDYMPIHMADLAFKALEKAGVKPEEAKVTVLGYAFLEDSDDTRNTPTVPFIEELKKRGIKDIVIHDPYVREEELPEVQRDLYKNLKDADCVCLITKHKEYSEIDFDKAYKLMRTHILIDGRNVWDNKFNSHKFIYKAIGK